jgi:hypothetical protein
MTAGGGFYCRRSNVAGRKSELFGLRSSVPGLPSAVRRPPSKNHFNASSMYDHNY